MEVGIAGAIANAVDAEFDHSVVNWMAVLTPWFNKAFNIADLAILFGLIEMLMWLIRLIVSAIVRGRRRNESQTEEG